MLYSIITSMNDQYFREQITNLFVFSYLPKIKRTVEKFSVDSYGKQQLANEISKICNEPVGIYLGELKVAEPTNDIIDKIVDIYAKSHQEKI